MNFKGKFHSASRDVDGNLILSFRCYEEKKALPELANIKEVDTLVIAANKPKLKRSLSMNGYYWTLIGQLASKMRISTSRCHNIMLRRYGTLENVDGESIVAFIPDTDKAENEALEAETYHLKPTSATKVFNDGENYRMYYVLKGSSQYDTKEMSTLINGIVDECNHVGIPTATPAEIAEMMKHYGKYHPT